VILAGGLTAANLVEAIRVVRPYAVDVNSGVDDRHGNKDEGRLHAFMSAAWRATTSARVIGRVRAASP
jgi:phosphoribosylanthranilate isomerase